MSHPTIAEMDSILDAITEEACKAGAFDIRPAFNAGMPSYIAFALPLHGEPKGEGLYVNIKVTIWLRDVNDNVDLRLWVTDDIEYEHISPLHNGIKAWEKRLTRWGDLAARRIPLDTPSANEPVRTLHTIDVHEVLSAFPCGRYKKEGGECTGEHLRELIVQALGEADRVHVNLWGVMGAPSSFMEEAFGGLVREEGFEAKALFARLSLGLRWSGVQATWCYIQHAQAVVDQARAIEAAKQRGLSL